MHGEEATNLTKSQRQGVHRAELEIPAKVSEKRDPFQPFGQKNKLFSSHTLYFNMKFQLLKMIDYCQKVLNDLKFPIN